jgi:hypothetical protein
MKTLFITIMVLVAVIILPTPAAATTVGGCGFDGCGHPLGGYVGCKVQNPPNNDCCASATEPDCLAGYTYYPAGFNAQLSCTAQYANQCNTVIIGPDTYDGLCETNACASGYCGDGFCSSTENICSCPTDCKSGTCSDVCNFNGVCDAGENSCNCASDCPGLCEGGCNGNGTCEPALGETSSNCEDCPVATCPDGVCSAQELSDGSCPKDCAGPPNHCPDGVCYTGENDPNSAYFCPEDCTGPVNCPYGTNWNGTACTAIHCGQANITGQDIGVSCASLTPSPVGAYYCSDGINTDDGNINTGTCCPANTVWTGANCLGTAQCNAPAACPAASPVSPPTPPNAYYSTAVCVGPTAYAGNPGACCNVGTKYGTNNYYDYSTATGSTTNNFNIY